MPLSFSDIPAGDAIFLDANVLIYALSERNDRRSIECACLVERCVDESVVGFTTWMVFADAVHKLMLYEAAETGRIPAAQAKHLADQPAVVRELSRYWQRAERLLGVRGLIFLPCEEEEARNAQKVRAEYGLMTGDSLIVAVMLALGIKYLASDDAGFDQVSGLTRFAPATP